MANDTNYTQLIKTLRGRGFSNPYTFGHHSALYDDAAEAIESLSAENASLRAKLEKLQGTLVNRNVLLDSIGKEVSVLKIDLSDGSDAGRTAETDEIVDAVELALREMIYNLPCFSADDIAEKKE